MGEIRDDRTRVERISDTELVVTRSFDAPPHLVFKAWTTSDLFMRWWAPQSIGMPLHNCEMDARTGGGYRLEFMHEGKVWPFFGKYLEVVPGERLVWTNEEDADGPVTTVTFEERDGQTLLTLTERYPSKEAFEAGIGAEGALPEQFAQLDALLATLET